MSPEFALACVRFVHFGSVMLLLGTVVFRRRMAVPEVAAALAEPLLIWEKWSATAALTSAALWLLVETAIAADGWAAAVDPGTVISVLTDTLFGNVWCGRLVLTAAVAGVSGLAPARTGLLLEAGAAVLAASLGFVGHGVMLSGMFGDLLSDVLGLHVLAAGLWIGPLPAVIMCLARAGRDFSVEAAASSIQRFSMVGHVAVVIALATGIAEARGILGTWMVDPTSAYQRLLAIKITAVASMILLALVNGYGFLPRFAVKRPSAQHRLAISCGLELALALLILALVAVLGDMAPFE